MAHAFEFFYDLGSPYSYLSAARIIRLDADIVWRPFLLGGIFQGSGNKAPASSPAKAKWLFGDLQFCADRENIPFKMARRFPLNTLRAQRALCAAEALGGQVLLKKLSMLLFEAFWVQDLDISDLAVVAELATAAGMDGAGIVAKAGEQLVKDQLRGVTTEALERGAFGAPTFFVGGQMFWGNDRLDYALEALK